MSAEERRAVWLSVQRLGELGRGEKESGHEGCGGGKAAVHFAACWDGGEAVDLILPMIMDVYGAGNGTVRV